MFRNKVNHTLPNNSVVLRKLLKKFKKEGVKGILSGHIGNQYTRKVTHDVEMFLNSLFADFEQKSTKAEIDRQYNGFLDGYIEVINNETGELYSAADFPRLSVSTITTYLNKWRNKIGTYGIRSGNRQIFMAQFKPYHSLEQPKYAGSIISVDDRQPVFNYAPTKRLWFYNAIDLGSEAFTCWVHDTTKEGMILDFYRQLVRNYAEWGMNLPAEIEAELNLNISFKDTFLAEGNMFQYVHIEPNNARASDMLTQYVSQNKWQSIEIAGIVRTGARIGNTKRKTEVLTANYHLNGI
ncbi:hypothetical protein FACS1894156_6970 [Bacteroidia bacterium]|nr:hypothetical protein FACS1894156_6970 [Bacteroidia bacterium]